MTLPSEIGARLPALRRVQGISQRELGQRVGATQPQIARWEATSYRSARLERVDAVARALGSPGSSAPLDLLAAEAPATYSAVESPTVQDLGGIAARLRGHSDELRARGLLTVSVFGSFATGTQREDSDIDLLVEFARPVGLAFANTAAYLEGLLGRSVDMVREAVLAEPVRQRARDEAVQLWHA